MMRLKLGFHILAIVLTVASGCSESKLAVADAAMERGEYYDASKSYRKIYNKLGKKGDRNMRGEVAFKLARAHQMLSQNARASVAYQNAIRFGCRDSMALLYLAQSLQAQGKYAEAIKNYEQYLELAPSDPAALEGLAGARMAAEGSGTTRYEVKNFKVANSRRAEFCPMIYDRTRGDVLYFSSTSDRSEGTGVSEITGMKNSDVWYVKQNEHGAWMAPEPVQGELNTQWDEGAVSFSPDGRMMYLTRARKSASGDAPTEICVSKREEGKWGQAELLVIGGDSLWSNAHPAVSPNGRWLYFTSDRPGGFGGKDIWRVRLGESVGEPENLGKWINTESDEMFPYMRDDTTLYFASNGHPGYGGLDIFKAEMQLRGGWKVSNMDTPINSPGDDFGITFGEGEDGFFSSNRGDARGYDNIYSFNLPQLKVSISGVVYDQDEEPLAEASVRLVGKDGSNLRQHVKPDGSFAFALEPGMDYVMMAAAKSYLNSRQEFTTDSAEEDAAYNIDFYLASITKPVVVDNIFYDYDKATLRPESKTALDSLAQVLRDNPNVTIEMGSHTDRHGSDKYNDNLSMRRAQSVVDYLIAAGIAPERLQAHGYGESEPKRITKKLERLYPQFKEGDVLDEAFVENLSPDDQEIADQINRRTEFRVLSTTYEFY